MPVVQAVEQAVEAILAAGDQGDDPEALASHRGGLRQERRGGARDLSLSLSLSVDGRPDRWMDGWKRPRNRLDGPCGGGSLRVTSLVRPSGLQPREAIAAGCLTRISRRAGGGGKASGSRCHRCTRLSLGVSSCAYESARFPLSFLSDPSIPCLSTSSLFLGPAARCLSKDYLMWLAVVSPLVTFCARSLPPPPCPDKSKTLDPASRPTVITLS
ncbi:hypothetical protein CDD83_1166 [Cordyceps sp. RAO-2017]|nr:hypothetical protein CDD83_1166 [Cordyceps sp. RAO-2017]